jgi:uncharacterized protein YyaL (SSP411 family)
VSYLPDSHQRGGPRRVLNRVQLRCAVLCACLFLTLARPGPRVDAQQRPPETLAEVHLARAVETRRFTAANFERPVGGPGCQLTERLRFSRGGDEPQWTDTWHSSQQIRADLAVASVSQTRDRCWINREIAALDMLWDAVAPNGGFFARATWDGDVGLRPDKYVDDNALAGLALAEAALDSPSRNKRAALVKRARATADYLIESGLWDETFGGGFWWNTLRASVAEGKPSQTSGLAAQLFFQLFDLTGEPRYRDWGSRTLAWLDSTLFDPAAGLYRWNIHYLDPATKQGVERSDRLFSYDQGILIEVNLQAYALDGDQRHLERAQLLARTLQQVFWDPAHGGYNLEATVPQVFTVYSAWLTPSLLALYERDRDPTWLQEATANLDAIDRTLWDPDQGGYRTRHFICRDLLATGCADGAPWVIATEKLLIDQATMQYAHARLAATILRGR